jgi:hypothetical protein
MTFKFYHNLVSINIIYEGVEPKNYNVDILVNDRLME